MSSSKLTSEDTKQDHKLQAILLCDTWGEELRWGPLVRPNRGEDEEEDAARAEASGSETRPWCLLPLLNVPLLAWTLECLAAAGVEEVIIFIGNGIEEVRTWLGTSTYTAPTSPISIILRPTTASTPGDVLREVDSLGILAPADFLVVQAGYIGNIDLAEKVKEFSERRKADPTLAMSCVVAPRKNVTTSKYAVHLLAPNHQLYHYEECSVYPRRKRARLPREALDGEKVATIRSDLESIGVQICSVEVPPLFTENFDYQYFYPDFVNGILTSDLLGKTICCTVLAENVSTVSDGIRKSVEWAAAIGNTKTYDFISKALLSRKVFPLAPDENMPNDSERYEARRGRVYLGKNLDLDRTSTVADSTLIGRDVSVGANTIISHSIISANTKIGSGCEITNSYIFEGANIGDGCIIRDSIIGEIAMIGEGAKIERGSLIAPGAKIGNQAHFSGRRIGKVAPEEEGMASGDSLGEGHSAFFWPLEEAEEDSDDSDDEDGPDPRNLELSRLGSQLQSLNFSSSSSSLSSMSRNSSTTSLSTSASHTQSNYEPQSIVGIDSLNETSAKDTKNDFISECEQSLERSFLEGHTVDNAAIELKTLRMASNVPLGEVRDVVIPFVLKNSGGANGVATIIERWGGLISSLIGNSEEAMISSILSAQKFIVENGNVDIRFFLRILKAFYEEDVITEEAVFNWYKSKESRLGAGNLALWNGSKPFLEALAQAESESGSE